MVFPDSSEEAEAAEAAEVAEAACDGVSEKYNHKHHTLVII